MKTFNITTPASRVKVTDLPVLNAPKADDKVLGIQEGSVGLYRLGDLPTKAAAPVGHVATQQALEDEAQAREQGDQAINGRVDGLEKKVEALPSGAASSQTVYFDIPGMNLSGTFEAMIFRRYEGGAGNRDSITFPNSWPKFAIPPVIVGTSTTITEEDWKAGVMGSGSSINIAGTSLTGFEFFHPGGWPGYSRETITFWVKGVVADSKGGGSWPV
ncbi:hypothetical protein GS501_02350 [Saccharibacter sp. 17.LH.SD]|uniref:hypothetical protein n=1 Tax=Saccharibacter sp. 17.LH.SD TaxID=2689393 RepID=UPI0013702AC8|nr:hypothetical protein [Saccharibacter sp. 17.LH.SD]MXV43893.1 hypothetical protein [Saccharibacter sp. 17.LH.SD]